MIVHADTVGMVAHAALRYRPVTPMLTGAARPCARGAPAAPADRRRDSWCGGPSLPGGHLLAVCAAVDLAFSLDRVTDDPALTLIAASAMA